MMEDFGVACSWSINQPWNSFQTNTDINNFDWQLFIISLIVVLVLHEHHVTKFETVNEILNWRTHVSSTGPNVFNESNLFRINFKFLREPSVIELDALLFEKDVIIGFVENVNTQHNEAWIMSTC